MHIAMIAAENGALQGGKVGGIGDVIRDVPLALAALGHTVSVITPGYQALSRRNPAHLLGTVEVSFCGRNEQVEVHRVMPAAAGKGTGKKPRAARAGEVAHYVLEHPLFGACGEGAIYCNDHYGPFATDAHKFALFCVAVAQLLVEERIAGIDRLHLHDWHAAMLAILRRCQPRYRALQALPTVFSIHNLSLQGVRPLAGDGSSLHSWFPDLVPELGRIQDPTHWDCVNLMRAGITLSDRVHAVSPNYAREILEPTDHARGFIGGEGLERDLQAVQHEGRLLGILNGCDYRQAPAPHRTRLQLLDLIEAALLDWVGQRQSVPAAHFHAERRVAQWRRRRRPVACTLTSVGRVTGQKVQLFLQRVDDGHGGECTALDRLLRDLHDGVFIMIGSGEETLEHFFTAAMARHDNFLFLRGFSEELAQALYAAGDLFLMPSSFEPCGISQMLAMRAGTPCIVHHVGGLRDTVVHGRNGLAFTGATPRAQAEALLDCVQQGVAMLANPAAWAALRKGAASARFTWDDVVRRYVDDLYAPLV